MHPLALGAFWQRTDRKDRQSHSGRNAPSGARCFLARAEARIHETEVLVVMHLLALGAFWQARTTGSTLVEVCRNAPSGARCFLADMLEVGAVDGQS